MASNPSGEGAAAGGSLDLNFTADRLVSSVADAGAVGEVAVVSIDVAAQRGASDVPSEAGGEGDRVEEGVKVVDEMKEGEEVASVVERRPSGVAGASVDIDDMYVEMGQRPEVVEKTEGCKGDAETSDPHEVKIAIEIEADTAEINFLDGKMMDRREIDGESGAEDKYFQDKEVEVPKKRGRGRPRRSPQAGQLQNDDVQVQEQGSSQRRKRGRPPKSAVKSNASGDRTRDENVQVSEQPSSSVKRKRGRPPKLAVLDTQTAEMIPCESVQTPTQQSSSKRKRGRPPRSAVESAKINDVRSVENTVVIDRASAAKNALGSSEHADDNLQHGTVQAGESASALKRKRGRPPRSTADGSQHTDRTPCESSQVREETLPMKRKRGRPRISDLYSTGDVDQLQDRNKQVGEEKSVARRKRGRPRRICLANTNPVRYCCHFQDESNGFAVSNLVWGKVKSHPWWPGQIFDASNASEMALNMEKKDHLLVAYFGDGTFAWCNESQLKPFQADFSQMEKENSTYAFLNAVHDALDEVSRQIELGMACSCLGNGSCSSLVGKNIENSGIQEGTIRSLVDKSWIVNSFQPTELVDYVQALAQAPYEGADRLEFVIANAQLKAFNCSKGHPKLPVYMLAEQFENDDQDSPSKNMESDKESAGPSTLIPSECVSGREKSGGKGSSSLNMKDVMEDGRKQRSLSELMEEDAGANLNRPGTGSCSYSSSRKLKISNAGVSYRVKTTKKRRLDSLGDVKAKPQKKRLKVGEHTHQIEGQFIASCHMLESNGQTIAKHTFNGNHRRHSGAHHDCPQEDQSVLKDYASPVEFLSQLSRVSADPLERRKFMNLKTEHPGLDNAAYTQDSYWPDIIVSDDPEEREKTDSQIVRQLHDEPVLSVALDLMSLAKEKLQSDSVTSNRVKDLKAERSIGKSDEVEECMPTELVLRMSDSDNFPVVADLIKFFGRYGPLREGETEAIEETKFAKVVFKRRADAELALSSAGECSIFGQASVSYRLRYLESPSKTYPNDALASEEVQKNAGAVKADTHFEAIGLSE